jgi:hypothetical protein
LMVAIEQRAVEISGNDFVHGVNSRKASKVVFYRCFAHEPFRLLLLPTGFRQDTREFLLRQI